MKFSRSTSAIVISLWLTACAGGPSATTTAETDSAQLQALASAQHDADVRAALEAFLHDANAGEHRRFLAGKRELEVAKQSTSIHCKTIHCHIRVVCHPGKGDVNDCSIDDSGCQDFDPGSCTP